MVGYLPIQLYTYMAIYLYAYVSTTSTLGGAFVCLGAGFPMRWMLSHVVTFVRGGDGALARTRVVAPGCAGDSVSALGSSTHTRRAYMPSLVYVCRPVSL